MKKTICLLTAMLLVLCVGCGVTGPKQAEAEPAAAAETPAPAATPEPTAEPTPTPTPEPSPTPEPDGEIAAAKADAVGIIGAWLSRGETVTVTGTEGAYYTIDYNGETLLVEQRFLRAAGAEAPEARSGYAEQNALVLGSPYLTGEVQLTLKRNAVVTVLEELGGVFLIDADGTLGYARAGQISSKKLSSGGGGGNSGQDGGDIVLGARPAPMTAVRLGIYRENAAPSEPFTGEGTVLADGVEAYRMLLSRGDTVKIVAEGENGMATVYTGGVLGEAELRLLRRESDGAAEEWDGFAKRRAKLYADHRTMEEKAELKLNTQIHVLDFTDFCYVVEVDGALGYMLPDEVSEKKLSSGGGGGGGDWTAPVL